MTITRIIGRNEEHRITLGSEKRFALRILRHVKIDESRDPVRILDFGGGDGTIAIEIAQRLESERLGRSRHPSHEMPIG